jgi:[1-hydroxy-2-(trimethylamino)ethyl]phosphonate dioxygenase
MNTVDHIFELFEHRGQSSYFGEQVSQLEHALQCAYLASQEGAPSELVAAALLHDIGHLLHEHGEDAADRGDDTQHERRGEVWLSSRFSPGVTHPIGLHVAAKRYLCATNPAYLSKLSPASVQSLELQGGAMSVEEVRGFEADPFGKAAVRLRLWDDAAKTLGAKVPDLHHYRNALESALTPTE